MSEKLSELLDELEAIIPGIKAQLTLEAIANSTTTAQALQSWWNDTWAPFSLGTLPRKRQCRLCGIEMPKGYIAVRVSVGYGVYDYHLECFQKQARLVPLRYKIWQWLNVLAGMTAEGGDKDEGR